MASECYPPPELNLNVPTIRKLPKKSKAWEELDLPVDFLFLTVKDCEYLSCLAFLTDYVKSYKKSFGYFYIGNIDELKIAVMKCEKGSSGPGGSIIAVKNAVAYLRPKAVFSVGFCGGLNCKKVHLGDVVVSAKLITYAPVKVTEDGIQERGISTPPKKDLANLIKHAGDSWEPPLVDTEALDVKVHRDGVFLSGPEVIDNHERQQQLVKRFPQAIAVEMEGEGLVTAAHDLDIDWVVIKGVSDFADGNKSDTESWRPFASVMAASLVADMLSDPVVFREWRHYEGEFAVQAAPPKPLPRRELRSTSSSDSTQATTEAALDAEESTTGKRRSSATHSSDRKRAKATTAKPGKPSDDELEELSHKLGDKWNKLGRRLGFEEAALTAFHKENESFVEKAYRMLMTWKGREGSDATYQVLYDALCHECVGLKDLAEKFCC